MSNKNWFWTRVLPLVLIGSIALLIQGPVVFRMMMPGVEVQIERP